MTVKDQVSLKKNAFFSAFAMLLKVKAHLKFQLLLLNPTYVSIMLLVHVKFSSISKSEHQNNVKFSKLIVFLSIIYN
jgi:hypothetical protein